MGILDDAIREHLELKRQHGAAESELEQLEGEAFGPAERPGSAEDDSAAAEAPTEFMATPEVADDEAEAEPAESAAASSRPDSGPSIADLQEGPEPKPAPEPEPEKPAEEEAPAMEHEAVPDPAVSQQGPSTEERQAIADPPTELYDVEGEEFGSEPQAPSDEALAEEEEAGEPRLAPAETPPPLEDDSPAMAVEEEEDDFFDEKRLSDELDQAMDAPLETRREDEEPEHDEEPDPEHEEEPESEEEPGPEEAPASRGEEDVLEETPDFLEEAPEDDQLWFEQKPPKDFDFDD